MAGAAFTFLKRTRGPEYVADRQPGQRAGQRR